MKRLTLLTATLSVVTLAGCAGGPATIAPADASAATTARGLEARAQQRWDYLVSGKAELAYDFFSPGYRQVEDRQTYVADLAVRPVRWTKAIVQGSQCPEGLQVCDVTVEVHYSLNSTLPGVGKLESFSPIVERWIQTEGNWYFVPKEVARSDRGLR